jgi:predicted peroxiredoxin
MKFLYIGTHGSEDPTRAGLNLLMAKGAKEAGHEVEIALQGDAVILFNETVAENVHPVGIPPIKELLTFMRTNKIPVYG